MKQLRPSAYGGSVKLDSSSKSTFNVKIADDPGDVDIPGVGKKNFRIYIDGGEIFDLDTASGGTSAGELVLTLRVLDYCDDSGDRKKMVVLASQPFSAE